MFDAQPYLAIPRYRSSFVVKDSRLQPRRPMPLWMAGIVQPRLCSALEKASITEQKPSCCISCRLVAALKETKGGSSISPNLSSPSTFVRRWLSPH